MHFVPHSTAERSVGAGNSFLRPGDFLHESYTPVMSRRHSRHSWHSDIICNGFGSDISLHDLHHRHNSHSHQHPHHHHHHRHGDKGDKDDKQASRLYLALPGDDHAEEDSSYHQSLREDLPIEHDCKAEECARVIINVSGLRFETQLRTLNRLPSTLLGDPEKRKKYWVPSKQEYFFDRHRPSFQAILYYYQSGGRLRRPLEVPIDIFLHELQFFELSGSTIESYKRNEGVKVDDDDDGGPEHSIQRKIWEILEYPESSYPARAFAITSILFIVTSVVVFCIETLPEFKENGCLNYTEVDANGNVTELRVPNYSDPLFIVESVCIVFFVLELLLRFLVTPSKITFFKGIANWIDFASVCPYFIFLFILLTTKSCQDGNDKSGVLSVLRVLRVVRILKLSKHSQGLKILGKTLQTSVRELSMFVLFLGIATIIFSGAVFYAELDQEQTQFTSIPDTFWWAIVSMTTVGYGDYVPVGLLGKLLGGLCVLSGVLAIALPVPVIVANFNNYYRQYTGRGYGNL